MNSLKKIIGLLFLLSVFGHASAQWLLDAVVQKNGEDNSLILDMTLTNKGETVVKTYASNLPWGIRHQLAMVAIPLAEYAPAFKPALYIDDPRHDPIKIRPGEVLHGKIVLNERFPELQNYKGKDPLVICYHYLFGEIDAGNNNVADGCLIVNSNEL